MNLLIQDDFFDKDVVDKLREIALSSNYTTHQEMNENSINPTGWKGSRTKKLVNYDKFFLYNCEKKIFMAAKEFFKFENLRITSFFHLTFEETRTVDGFLHGRYHKDQTSCYAGVLYLTPSAPLKMGTSILDEENNKIISVQNVYNRLVVYPASYLHAVSDVFGITKENARMTLTFFIHNKDINLDRGNP